MISTMGFGITDPIYGHMPLHNLVKVVINTEEMQRTKNIKQLGGSYHVFPAAEHSRFVHSLGVCHLAREMVETLQKGEFGDRINDQDILCVSLAGLFHDLGHGPLSHLWQDFMQSRGKDWRHEEQSVKMIHAIADELRDEFKNSNLFDEHVNFICELVDPPKIPADNSYPFKHCKPGKEFLYFIVSNPFSGIDVDKMDYLARDSRILGLDYKFDYRRFFPNMKIVEKEEYWNLPGGEKVKQMHVGFRDKLKENFVDLLMMRQNLHRKAYQHKTTKIVETFLRRAFTLVDDEEIFAIRGADGINYRLSTAFECPKAYLCLTDHIESLISMILPENVPEPKRHQLREAQDLFIRIKKRHLPKMVHEVPCQSEQGWVVSEEDVWKKELILNDSRLGILDVEMILASFDLGQKGADPIKQILFYHKDGTQESFSLSEILPSLSATPDQKIRVYATCREKRALVRAAAREWGKARGSPLKRLCVNGVGPLETPPQSQEKMMVETDRSTPPLFNDCEATLNDGRPDTPPLSQEKKVVLEDSLLDCHGVKRNLIGDL